MDSIAVGPATFISLALAVLSSYLLVFRVPRFAGSGLGLPLLIVWATSAGYGVCSVGVHIAAQIGDPELAEELLDATIIASALGAPGFVHLISRYPKRLASRWVGYGVSGLYLCGIALMLLGSTPLIIHHNGVAANGHPVTSYAPLWGAIQVPFGVGLVAAIAWLAHLARRGRTRLERTGARGLLLAAAPPIVGFVALASLGVNSGTDDTVEVGTLLYMWWAAVIAAVLASGRMPAPVPSALDSVIGSVTDGVLIIDAEGTVLRHNAAAREMLGMPEADLQACPIGELFRRCIENEEQAKLLTMVTMGVLRGRMDLHQQTVAGVGPLRLACRLQVLPLGARGGARDVPGAILLFEDATERLKLAEAMKRTSDLQDLVIRVLGHDLKGPLAVIQGYVDLGKHRLSGQPTAESVEKARFDLDKIAEAAAGMLILMSNARAISALGASASGALQTRDTDLSGLVTQTTGQMRPLAAARHMELIEEIAPGVRGALVPGFESVVRNLVDNAIKYTPPGGTVWVKLSQGAATVLEVIDTGSGVPVEVRDRIFAKFERLGAESGKVEGHGLGLSIVASLVALSGGTVAVTDRADGRSGAVFKVTLPATSRAPPK